MDAKIRLFNYKSDIYDIKKLEADLPNGLRAIDLRKFQNHTTYSGLSVVKNEEVVAYVMYCLHLHSYSIERIAVKLSEQRNGLGTSLFENIIFKMNNGNKRTCIKIDVPEENLPLQLFLANLNFKFVDFNPLDRTIYKFQYGEKFVPKTTETEKEQSLQRYLNKKNSKDLNEDDPLDTDNLF